MLTYLVPEVASNGSPIICSDIPANKYFLGNKVIYFEPDDFIDLAKKVDYALDSYPGVKRKVIYLQEEIKKKFNWYNVAGKYSDLYKMVNGGLNAK